MKIGTLILPILLLLSNIGISQTPPPEIVFDTLNVHEYFLEIINDYREENGLNRLVLDTGLQSACRYHAAYLSTYNQSTHFYCDADTLIEHDPDPRSRAKKFKARSSKMVGENCFNIDGDGGLSAEDWSDEPIVYPHFLKFRISIKNGVFDYKLAAQYGLAGWIWSEAHRKLLLKEGATTGAVYLYVYENPKDGRLRMSGVFMTTDHDLK